MDSPPLRLAIASLETTGDDGVAIIFLIKNGSSGFRVGNQVFLLPWTRGMTGGVSGHVEPRAWDHDPRRGRACPAQNQASALEKGAARSAPTIPIPQLQKHPGR